MRFFRFALAAALALTAITCTSRRAPSPPPNDPTPQTLEEFHASAARVLQETGVPGAGIALVRVDGLEWAGGIGYADREANTPVTADTHFRAGSISKTFVAMGLVQMYEDGDVDLEAPVAEIVPEIAIDNPWHATHPVRVIHLLQHTAGFDDMHFRDRYVAEGTPVPSLFESLNLNPRARRVRWQPGTRMAYSNVGYGVAGFILEKLAGQPYEDYIKHEIFDPLGMTTSSFRLGPEDEANIARGYEDSSGPSVGFSRIHLRPAGNLHTSARELGRFVQMLLGWGELGTAFVVDPEYLGNMEQPKTTLAAAAGLRNGYGSGIGSILDLPYPLLGHGGGIDGYLSQYAYSPSRDVGFVILLNRLDDRASEAMNRLSSLAIRYLKRDVDAPAKRESHVDTATLDQYVGYYHDANPRNEVTWPLQWFLSGRMIVRRGDALYARRIVGSWEKLVPVSDRTFRHENEADASMVFTQDAEGTAVLAGGGTYAERRPRWRIEMVRVPVLATLPILLSVFIAVIAWLPGFRRLQSLEVWTLKLMLLLCPLVLVTPVVALALTPMREWGTANAGTIAVFAASVALPIVGGMVAVMIWPARRAGAGRWLTGYAFLVASATIGLAAYLGSHQLLGLRLWRY